MSPERTNVLSTWVVFDHIRFSFYTTSSVSCQHTFSVVTDEVGHGKGVGQSTLGSPNPILTKRYPLLIVGRGWCVGFGM